MGHYNNIERHVGMCIRRFAWLHNTLKIIYQFINYLLFSINREQFILHQSVLLEHLSESKEHFYGYYGGSSWSIDGKWQLYHRVISSSVCELVAYSIDSGEKKIVATLKNTWNWQQGAMATWYPGGDNWIAFNDYCDGDIIGKIVDLEGREISIFKYPFQSISADGSRFVSINYARLSRFCEYGYKCKANNFPANISLKNDGIWLIDYATKKSELLLSIDRLQKLVDINDGASSKHKVNHVEFSPCGKKIAFFYRFYNTAGRQSYLYALDLTSRDLILIFSQQPASHYTWTASSDLIAWACKNAKYSYYKYLFSERECQHVGAGILDDTWGDGHPSISPCGNFMVSDTYPNRAGMQFLWLLDLRVNKKYLLGEFFSPWKYRGAFRCDLHPRWSRDGTQISIDSAHSGKRALYLINVKHIVG